ncbi:MAG: hypothetical protein FRX49_07229 [Trebouxia sp. A1-2]|nr:MAG: hypothetical protein FRX49_07229 [Trebouxia sp. A1-2]
MHKTLKYCCIQPGCTFTFQHFVSLRKHEKNLHKLESQQDPTQPNKKAIAKQEKLAKCYWVRHTDDGEVRCEQATLAELNGLIEEREHPPQAKKRKDVGTEDDVYKDDIEDAATKENANPNVKGTSKPGRATGKQNKIRAALEAKASKKARK